LLKQWKADQAAAQLLEDQRKQDTDEAKLEEFRKTNMTGSLLDDEARASTSSSASTKSTDDITSKMKVDKVFWLPQNTPSAKESSTRPSQQVRCPITKRKLILRDLIEVHFTESGSLSKSNLSGRKSGERYVCPLSGKQINNRTRCVVLPDSGRVITREAYLKTVKPEGRDPFTNHVLLPERVIELQRDSTGFAAGGGTVVAVKKKEVMLVG